MKRAAYSVSSRSDNARTHLREKHSRLPKAERALICEELQAWQGVSHSHEHFEIPQAVDQPVQGLRLFQDGKQCELDPEQCTFVCRSMDSLKKHWRTVTYTSGPRLGEGAGPGQRRHFMFLSRSRRMHESLFVVSAFSTQDATQATSQCFRRGDSRIVTLDGESRIRTR
jgi:hypothetical protein